MAEIVKKTITLTNVNDGAPGEPGAPGKPGAPGIGAQILRATNEEMNLDVNLLYSKWEYRGWRSASGGTATRTQIAITDCPDVNCKWGWQFSNDEAPTKSESQIAQDSVPIYKDKTYTLSCWIRCNSKADSNYPKFRNSYASKIGEVTYFAEQKGNTSSEWVKYSWTFTPTVNSPSIYFGLSSDDGSVKGDSIQITGFKLEEGSVATDWCENELDRNLEPLKPTRNWSGTFNTGAIAVITSGTTDFNRLPKIGEIFTNLDGSSRTGTWKVIKSGAATGTSTVQFTRDKTVVMQLLSNVNSKGANGTNGKDSTSYWLDISSRTHQGPQQTEAIIIKAYKQSGSNPIQSLTTGVTFEGISSVNHTDDTWTLTAANLKSITNNITCFLTVNDIIVDQETIVFSASTPVMTLTNENASIAYNESTKINTSDTVSSTAMLWLNGKQVTGLTYTWTLSNCATSNGKTTNDTIIISTLSANTGTATCTINYNNSTYTKVFTITKQLKGEQGIQGNKGADGNDGASAKQVVAYYCTNKKPKDGNISAPTGAVDGGSAGINKRDIWCKGIEAEDKDRVNTTYPFLYRCQGTAVNGIYQWGPVELYYVYDGEVNGPLSPTDRTFYELINNPTAKGLNYDNAGNLYFIADYINTGVLRVGTDDNLIFKADITKKTAKIAGFDVDQNSINKFTTNSGEGTEDDPYVLADGSIFISTGINQSYYTIGSITKNNWVFGIYSEKKNNDENIEISGVGITKAGEIYIINNYSSGLDHTVINNKGVYLYINKTSLSMVYLTDNGLSLSSGQTDRLSYLRFGNFEVSLDEEYYFPNSGYIFDTITYVGRKGIIGYSRDIYINTCQNDTSTEKTNRNIYIETIDQGDIYMYSQKGSVYINNLTIQNQVKNYAKIFARGMDVSSTTVAYYKIAECTLNGWWKNAEITFSCYNVQNVNGGIYRVQIYTSGNNNRLNPVINLQHLTQYNEDPFSNGKIIVLVTCANPQDSSVDIVCSIWIQRDWSYGRFYGQVLESCGDTRATDILKNQWKLFNIPSATDTANTNKMQAEAYDTTNGIVTKSDPDKFVEGIENVVGYRDSRNYSSFSVNLPGKTLWSGSLTAGGTGSITLSGQSLFYITIGPENSTYATTIVAIRNRSVIRGINGYRQGNSSRQAIYNVSLNLSSSASSGDITFTVVSSTEQLFSTDGSASDTLNGIYIKSIIGVI